MVESLAEKWASDELKVFNYIPLLIPLIITQLLHSLTLHLSPPSISSPSKTPKTAQIYSPPPPSARPSRPSSNPHTVSSTRIRTSSVSRTGLLGLRLIGELTAIATGVRLSLGKEEATYGHVMQLFGSNRTRHLGRTFSLSAVVNTTILIVIEYIAMHLVSGPHNLRPTSCPSLPIRLSDWL